MPVRRHRCKRGRDFLQITDLVDSERLSPRCRAIATFMRIDTMTQVERTEPSDEKNDAVACFIVSA